MSDERENGIVYHIDINLIIKAREEALKKEIGKVDRQIAEAERDLNLVKIAEASLEQVQQVLGKMRGIAVEAANNPKADRKALNMQLNRLKRETDMIIQSATVDGINLLDGSLGGINDVIAAISKALND